MRAGGKVARAYTHLKVHTPKVRQFPVVQLSARPRLHTLLGQSPHRSHVRRSYADVNRASDKAIASLQASVSQKTAEGML